MAMGTRRSNENSHRTSTELPRKAHGTSTEDPVQRKASQDFHGSKLMILWKSHGSLMGLVLPWCFHGSPMVHPWDPIGNPSGFLGTSAECLPWDSNVFCKNNYACASPTGHRVPQVASKTVDDPDNNAANFQVERSLLSIRTKVARLT